MTTIHTTRTEPKYAHPQLLLLAFTDVTSVLDGFSVPRDPLPSMINLDSTFLSFTIPSINQADR